MKKIKAAAGTLISAVAIIVFLYLFSVIVTFFDSLLGVRPTIAKYAAVFGAAPMALIGLFFITWAYGYLLFIGRGSPVELFGAALLPTRNLVTCGPYAYTRNPMLLGAFFLMLSVTFYTRTLSGLILTPILTSLAAIYIKTFEEPLLEKRFGDAYKKYRSTVPMIFPFLHSLFTGEPEDTCGIAANEKPDS